MYCPHCDMDFVDGITVCSDCGRKLITREEYAKQLEEQAAAAAEKERLAREEARQAVENAMNDAASDEELTEDIMDEDPDIENARKDIIRSTLDEPAVYVSKSSEYEDNKSSAGAFLSVGGILTAVMIAVYAGLITLPAAFNSILSKVMLTVIGVGFIAIGVMSLKKAGKLKAEAAEEAECSKELIRSFTDNYTKEEIEYQARLCAGEEAGEEEMAIACLSYIRDEIITVYGIGDEAYADSISEEIYEKIFEVGEN